MLKEYPVQYNGESAIVKIEDDLPFGIFEDINRKYITVGNIMQGDIKVEMVGYRYAITIAAIKEAPWIVNDLRIFKDLPKSLGREMVQTVCGLYPLKECLLDWMEAAMGEVTEEDVRRINKILGSQRQ